MLAQLCSGALFYGFAFLPVMLALAFTWYITSALLQLLHNRAHKLEERFARKKTAVAKLSTKLHETMHGSLWCAHHLPAISFSSLLFLYAPLRATELYRITCRHFACIALSAISRSHLCFASPLDAIRE